MINFSNSHTTIVVGSIGVYKEAQCNMLSPIIDSTKKNYKGVVDAMDKIIVTQLDIEEHGSKLDDHTFKEQIHNLKSRNKDLHNMGKTWSMCCQI